MSAVEILLGAVEPIGIRFRRGATLTTGATVRARVLRTSDGKELDWSTNTFVVSGSAVQPRQTLTESPAGSGAYEYSWNTSTVTNPTTPDTYLVEYDQTTPVVRAFIRQSEIRVREAQAVSAAVAALPTAASNASAVWSTAVPGAFLSGSAGFVVGSNLNATVASRAVPGDAMTLTAGERAATGTAVWATATRTLTAGAISASTFAADAIDANALAASAASEVGTAVWATATRTVTGTSSGAITSSSFAANALGAAWDEPAASHIAVGTFGLRVGTNLDAAVSTRSTLTQAQIVSDSTPFLGARIDAAVSSRAVPGSAMALTSGAITSSTFGADAIDSNALAASAASEVAGKVWDELTAAHATGGTFGLLVGTNLDAAVGSRATPAQVTAAADAVRGADSRDLTEIAGAGFTSAAYSLVTTGNELAALLTIAQSFQGVSGFVALIPQMATPVSGTTAYEIQVFISDSVGTPIDPDGNTITVAVENGADVDRSANLSSTTMTRLGVGHYEVFYNVAFDAAVEQLVFSFSYAISATPFARVATTTLNAGLNVFTDADRTVLNSISADTGAIKGAGFTTGTDSLRAIRVRGDGAWTTAVGFSSPGDAMALTLSERSSVASRLWSEALPGAYGAGQAGFFLDAAVSSRATAAGASAAVWGAGTRTLTSVSLDAGSLTSGAIGSGYVAAVQSGLATAAQVPNLVWDEALSGHATAGSAGKALTDAQAGSNPAATAAAVWATPEGAGTMGASLALLRRRTTNRRKVDANGVVTFYSDADSPERSATLKDINGGPVVVVPGDPAESTAEV